MSKKRPCTKPPAVSATALNETPRGRSSDVALPDLGLAQYDNQPARSRPGQARAALATITAGALGESADLPVWGPLPGEPEELHARFMRWLTASERGQKRSIQAVAEEVGRAPATLYESSHRWAWRERALAYDRHVAAQAAESASEIAGKAAREQARLAQRLTDLAAKAIEDADQSEDAEAIVRAATAVGILERAQRVQRLATGQSTSNAAHAHHHTVSGAENPDARRMTTDQRAALRYALHLAGVPDALPANLHHESRDAHFRLAVQDLNTVPPKLPNQPNQ